MKYVKMLNLVLAITLLIVGCVWSKGNVVKPKPQTTCPVMGGKINREVYAGYEGKRVYFCCKGCITEFQKDPAQYVKKLEDEGVTLEEAPGADDKKESIQGTDEGVNPRKVRSGCGCGGCS